MIFLCHAYLTFECSTLLLEEDRLTVISMWSAKECGWSEIKVNASPKDQHWHCSAQRLQLSTEGLLSAFVVVPCLSGMMMKASILLFDNDIDEENVCLTSDRGKLIQRGGRGSQSSSLFNQDALPPSPPLCSTELHRSISFYLNVFEFTSIHIYTTAFHTQTTFFCRAVSSSAGSGFLPCLNYIQCERLVKMKLEDMTATEVGASKAGQGCSDRKKGYNCWLLILV